MSWSLFNNEQLEWMEELSKMDPKTKCWCGWDRFGQCPSCAQKPDVKDLTLADKLPFTCPACRSSPWRPGEKVTHHIGCSIKYPEFNSSEKSVNVSMGCMVKPEPPCSLCGETDEQ